MKLPMSMKNQGQKSPNTNKNIKNAKSNVYHKNYNEYLPDSKEKLQEINTKAKELYQQYRNFNNLRMHIKQLLMFMSRHTEEFKEMQHDFFEIKQLLQQSQSGEAISISKTTAPHAVSYPFTSIYNVDRSW